MTNTTPTNQINTILETPELLSDFSKQIIDLASSQIISFVLHQEIKPSKEESTETQLLKKYLELSKESGLYPLNEDTPDSIEDDLVDTVDIKLYKSLNLFNDEVDEILQEGSYDKNLGLTWLIKQAQSRYYNGLFTAVREVLINIIAENDL